MCSPSKPGLSKPPAAFHAFSLLPLTDWNDNVHGNLGSQALKTAEQLLAWVLNDHVEQGCAFSLKTHLDC